MSLPPTNPGPLLNSIENLPFPGTIDDLRQKALADEQYKAAVKADLDGKPAPVQRLHPEIEVTEPQYKFEPLFGLDNLVDVWHAIHPNTRLYPWQYEELMRISGYVDGTRHGPRLHWTPDAPLRANHVCCNGSGKDMALITTTALGMPLLYRNVIVPITSASHAQLKGQTENHIIRGIEALNARFGTKLYDSVEFRHKIKARGGEIELFCTDEPGRAEGWHPRDPTGRLIMIVNERKTIPEDIITALNRCHGFSHWLNVSSPGPRLGSFFRNYHDSTKFPNRPEPFTWWSRKVDWTLCPHISPAYFEAQVKEYGINSSYIQTSFLANFFEEEANVLISFNLLLALDGRKFQQNPNDIGIGLDGAGGGDETSLYVRFGPVPTRRLFFRDPNTIRATDRIHEFLVDLKDQPYVFNLDDNGLSRTFGDSLERKGWKLSRRISQSRSTLPARYVNLDAQMWDHNRKLLERGQIMSPDDELTRSQLTIRKKDETKHVGRMMLESKDDLQARGIKSLDRADAWVQAFYSYRPDKFYTPLQEGEVDPETLSSRISLAELNERLMKNPHAIEHLFSPPRRGEGSYTLLSTKSIQ